MLMASEYLRTLERLPASMSWLCDNLHLPASFQQRQKTPLCMITVITKPVIVVVKHQTQQAFVFADHMPQHLAPTNNMQL
jgi:hypothetical protein